MPGAGLDVDPSLGSTAAKARETLLLSALAYPTFQGNANVKFLGMTPVKMLDWENPLC
jgi:hypothetical protein